MSSIKAEFKSKWHTNCPLPPFSPGKCDLFMLRIVVNEVIMRPTFGIFEVFYPVRVHQLRIPGTIRRWHFPRRVEDAMEKVPGKRQSLPDQQVICQERRKIPN